MTVSTGADLSRVVNHVLVPPVGTFDLDPAHTFVGFTAQHLVVGRVRGRFESVKGSVTVAEDPSASTVEVVVDTASINTLNAIRDDDLRSERYLEVERYPTMTYRSTATTELSSGSWLVSGELTLHGVTRPLDLTVRYGGAVTDPYGNSRVAFRTHTAITRHEFGLTFELVKEAGGLLVGRDVAIEIDAEAICRQ
jgi:polyisoprenoid-binding protein YceI